MKRFLIVLLSCLLVFALFSCSDGENAVTDGSADKGTSTAAQEQAPSELSGNENIARIELADGGVIRMELYPDIAPITVENFKNLASSGFYDGLIFHRVIKDFMIQGGDPNGDGTGGSPDTIKGEFTANGFSNTLSHTRGVVSMARRGDSMDSASSQFFICHADSTYLDGQYASFGRVIEGMDVVDRIANVSTDANDKPLEDVVIKTIYLEGEYTATEATDDGGVSGIDTVTDSAEPEESDIELIYTEGTVKAEIEMENGGIIKLDLYPEIAPITVNNFAALAKDGFYDGLIFHRVIKDFMIQGGDPLGNGTGGSDVEIKGEFSSNGVENNLSHTRGTISMARAYMPDSASSQFFICHADSTYLDGQYAAFGVVTEGMEVVDEIAAAETDANDKPLEDIVIKTIRIVEE